MAMDVYSDAVAAMAVDFFSKFSADLFSVERQFTGCWLVYCVNGSPANKLFTSTGSSRFDFPRN